VTVTDLDPVYIDEDDEISDPDWPKHDTTPFVDPEEERP